MGTLFHIDPFSLGIDPKFFFFLGVYLAVAILFYEGYRRDYPIIKWALVLLSSITFSLLFSKFFSFSSADWQRIFVEFQWPIISDISLIGWLLGTIIAGLISASILGIPKGVADSIAFAWPVGLAITRVGCLIGGCCYGTETHSFFAVDYARAESLLHPTQFYEILICIALLISAYALFKRKVFKRPGNLGFFTFLFYAFFRFFIEFIRAEGSIVFGLKIVQWVLLSSIIILAVYLFISERKYLHSFQLKKPKLKIYHPELLIVTISLLLGIIGIKILTYTELFIVASLWLITAVLYFNKYVLNQISYSGLKYQFAILVFSVLLMSQTFISDSLSPKFEHTIYVGALGGTYSTICGDTYPYNVSTIGYEGKYNLKTNQNLTYNLNYYRLNDHGGIAHGVSPGFGFESTYFHVKTGVNLDTLGIYPMLDLRVGKKFFIEGKINPSQIYLFPDGNFMVGLGYNWNENIRTSLGLTWTGFYLNSYFYIDGGLYFAPYVSYGDADNYAAGLMMGVKFPVKKYYWLR